MMSDVLEKHAEAFSVIERKAGKAIKAIESAVEKLEMALSGTAPVSKNTLIKEAIKILKG